jgi:hypothetical protein
VIVRVLLIKGVLSISWRGDVSGRLDFLMRLGLGGESIGLTRKWPPGLSDGWSKIAGKNLICKMQLNITAGVPV